MHILLQMQDQNKSSDRDSDGEGQDTKQGSKGDKDSADEHEKGKGAKKDSRYTFSMTETTILEVVMDSMRTCALALALQALSTVLLGRMQQHLIASPSPPPPPPLTTSPFDIGQ